VSALELAERALREAGPDALALVTRERSLLLRFAANRPTQATEVDDLTVELAVVRRGHVGRAETNSTDDEALAACAQRAAAAAEAAASAGHGVHPGFADVLAAVPPAAAPAPFGAAVGGDALATVFGIAADAGLEAHGTWSAAEVERAVARPGSAVAEVASDAFMKVICMPPTRDDGRSGHASQAAPSAAALEPGALGRRAASKALGSFARSREPTELAAGEHPVVFEPDAMRSLLDLLAHTAFNGLAHAEEHGALSGRLGERVAAPAVNLSDAPRFPRTLSRSFDAEGTPKAALPLIQDGVAHRVVHDIRSAALMGTASTGHAVAPGGAPSGPHPTNLVLAGGGAADTTELCAPVERGIYVTRLWYENVVRPKEALVTAVTRDGTFLIEDGQVTRPLHDLRLTDSVLSILSSVQALSAGLELSSDGEFYGRRFAYGVVSPAVRVGRVRFTGPAG
jgi:predicted Zn-dependent protease